MESACDSGTGPPPSGTEATRSMTVDPPMDADQGLVRVPPNLVGRRLMARRRGGFLAVPVCEGEVRTALCWQSRC